VAEGLLASTIHAIVQDDSGYLWLGADSGLIRFDGFGFTTWGTQGEPPLPGRIVMSLMATRDGSLWVGFGDAGGVSRLRDGHLVHYRAEQGLAADFVLALLELHDGTILAGTRRGVARFNGTQWELLGRADGLPSAAVHSLYEDRKHTLWAGTAQGVFCRRPGIATFERVSDSVVQRFTEDAAGTVWITDARRGFDRLFKSAASREYVGRPGDAVGSALYVDSHGTIWVGTSGQGLWRARPDGTVEQIGLADQVISSVFEDRDGNVWVGTHGGLVRFYPHDVTMITHTDGLLSNTVRAMDTAPDGTVWIGTVDGLDSFTDVGGVRKHRSYRLPNTRVTALHIDRAGTIWLGTETGVSTFDHGRLSAVGAAGANLGTVFAMTSDDSGQLWLCHVGAASPSRLDHGTLIDLDQVPEVRGRSCTSAFTDSGNRVWMGFADGSLVSYDGGLYRLFSTHDGLTGGSIYSIWEDAGHTLWVGTSKGISRIRDGRITSVTDRNGLPDTDVTAIVGDRLGNIWCAFNGGIVGLKASEIDRVAEHPQYRIQSTFLNESDGLLSPPTRYGFPTGGLDGDGAIWIQTVSGLAVVDPRSLRAGQSAQVRIERAVVDGQALIALGGLMLPPHPSRVEIHYSALSLGGASKVRFSFRLDGVDTDWVDAGAHRQAYYTNLSPGTHQFRVRATMNGLDDVAAWTFLIEPAFYQTGWFYGLSALGLVLAVWSTWRLRLRAMHSQFAGILEERARIGREIHDTLLQNMAGTALKLEGITAALDASAHPSAPDLRKVRRQIQKYLTEARESILNLRSSTIERGSLVDVLQASVSEIAEHSSARVDVATLGRPIQYAPAIELEMLRIGQEAVRNAIRHGRAGRIRVELRYDDDELGLRVTDDGRGFNPEDPSIDDGHRWGLIGMSERVHRLGGEFRIESRPGEGTAVIATLHRPDVVLQ
jgi:signal transduction histidine kinase/ligand-binding sensor domain-containing protein